MNSDKNKLQFRLYSGQNLTVRFERELIILFGLSGTSEIICSQKKFHVNTAGVLLLNPYTVYRLQCPSDASVLCCRISEELLKQVNWKPCFCYIPGQETESETEFGVKTYLAELFQFSIEQKKNSRKGYDKEIRKFLEYIQLQYPAAGLESQVRESTLSRMENILQHIQSHWNEDLSLAKLAEEEYLSVSYLSRFFQKNLQMSFSQYVKEIRLGHGAEMLTGSSHSVTHIAYDCGFQSPSVFIEAFKQHYRQTPGQYRQEKQEEIRKQADPKNEEDSRSKMAVLLAYLPTVEEENLEQSIHEIQLDVQNAKMPPAMPGRRILNIGYAKDLLLAPIQNQIQRAQKDIGFEYIRFHGLLDEDMHIYWEDDNGNPRFVFYYMDLLFDYILETGLKPFVELGFMPPQIAREETRIYDRTSVISGCRDIQKWEQLIYAVVDHLVSRYGVEIVRTWRFTTISQSYVHLNCVDWEDYKTLYAAAHRMIKSVDCSIQFGGPGCFAELIDRETGIPAFLSFAKEQSCEPDFVSFQFYPHVHTYDSMFMDFTLNQDSSPAILSEDPDYLLHTLEKMELLLKERGMAELEVYLEESNSTLWQRDLSGDTLYKAAWLAKNLSDSYGRVVFGYWLLTDLLEERARIDSVFHGGYGLMTYNGIPKAGYRALELIRNLGDKIISSGDGWIAAADHAGAVQILLYNYSHYSDLYRFRYQRLERPEDAYSVFEPGQIRNIQLTLTGFSEGEYQIRRRKITRDHGSSFDRWMELGAPKSLRKEEVEYLKNAGESELRMEKKALQHQMYLESQLKPLEVELLQILPIT